MIVGKGSDAEKPVEHRSWLYRFFFGPRKSALLGGFFSYLACQLVHMNYVKIHHLPHAYGIRTRYSQSVTSSGGRSRATTASPPRNKEASLS
jgi:hypothetical protein